MRKIYCIGDAIMDFIPVSSGDAGSNTGSEGSSGAGWLAPMPGGAPANAAAAAAKLGARALFIGKVGDDSFGRNHTSALSGYGVDISFVRTTAEACTTMAFVTLTPDGEREFTFARKPGADMLLSEDDIPAGIFSEGDILHFGTLGLVPGAPSKKAHQKAISAARSSGSKVYYDPNLRFPLWDSLETLRETTIEFLPFSDIVKVSSDELPFIFGTEDEQAAAAYCFGLGVLLFLVTRGKEGAAVYTPDYYASVEGIHVTAVDTTGAGDAFNGAVMSRLISRPFPESLKPEELSETLRFANAAGAITVTRKGAMAGSPTAGELESFINNI